MPIHQSVALTPAISPGRTSSGITTSPPQPVVNSNTATTMGRIRSLYAARMMKANRYALRVLVVRRRHRMHRVLARALLHARHERLGVADPRRRHRVPRGRRVPDVVGEGGVRRGPAQRTLPVVVD